MNVPLAFQNKNIPARMGGEAKLNDVCEHFFSHMLDDYHINRFFNSSDINQKSHALSHLLMVYSDSSTDAEQREAALNDFFLDVFARSRDKTLIQASDFGFFGMIIEQNHPSNQFICDMHAHLLKFIPEDLHYDAALEHLQSALQETHVGASVAKDLMQFAESIRNPVLGK